MDVGGVHLNAICSPSGRERLLLERNARWCFGISLESLGEEHHPVSTRDNRIVKRGDEVGVEDARHVCDNDCDRSRASGDEAPANVARNVAQLRCSGSHPLLRRLGNAVVVAESPRDSGLRDADSLCDVVARDVARRSASASLLIGVGRAHGSPCVIADLAGWSYAAGMSLTARPGNGPRDAQSGTGVRIPRRLHSCDGLVHRVGFVGRSQRLARKFPSPLLPTYAHYVIIRTRPQLRGEKADGLDGPARVRMGEI